MIVVIGQPLYRAVDGEVAAADGLPARIAFVAAAHGRSVQLVGKAGEDPEGDAVVLALGAGGVGHVAVLRDAGSPTHLAAVADDSPVGATEVDADGPAVADKAARQQPPSPLDAQDVELAMRYLTEYTVVVLADAANTDVLKVVADASGWVGARLVLVVPPGQPIPEDLPADVIVFEAPAGDPDGAFAAFVGTFAAALDEGEDPADAFQSSIESDGWTASPSG